MATGTITKTPIIKAVTVRCTMSTGYYVIAQVPNYDSEMKYVAMIRSGSANALNVATEIKIADSQIRVESSAGAFVSGDYLNVDVIGVK